MIVLDTHAWVWFIGEPELLSKRAEKALTQAVTEGKIYISSISAREVALLVKRKRLKLSIEVGEWIKRSERLPFFEFVPVDNTIALSSITLKEPLHGDPADRIIAATAITLGIPLVTKDTRLQKYPYVTTLWSPIHHLKKRKTRWFLKTGEI